MHRTAVEIPKDTAGTRKSTDGFGNLVRGRGIGIDEKLSSCPNINNRRVTNAAIVAIKP